MYLYQVTLAKNIIAVFLIVANCFSVIFAIVTISISVTAISSLQVIQDLDGRLYYLTNAIGLIAFCGVLWLISSWIGTFAACATFYSSRDICKQTAYGSHTVFLFLMIILVVFEFIGAMVVFSIRDDLVDNFEDVYLEMLQNGLSTQTEDYKYELALDRLQTYFTCCGYNGPEDYSTTEFGAYGRLVKSCCAFTQSSFDQCYQIGPGVINYGCKSKIEDLITKHYTEIGTVGICFGFVELLSITLSCLLMFFIYKEDAGCVYTKC